MQNLDCDFMKSLFKFMTNLIICVISDIRIPRYHIFPDKNILTLLLDHLRQIFDDVYQCQAIGRET